MLQFGTYVQVHEPHNNSLLPRTTGAIALRPSGNIQGGHMEQNVHMLLDRTIVELIVKLDPSLYRKYIWENKKGKLMLYVKLKKALYGTLQVALLFWHLLLDTLIEWGFKLNKYDKCVTHKIFMENNVLSYGMWTTSRYRTRSQGSERCN